MVHNNLRELIQYRNTVLAGLFKININKSDFLFCLLFDFKKSFHAITDESNG